MLMSAIKLMLLTAAAAGIY